MTELTPEERDYMDRVAQTCAQHGLWMMEHAEEVGPDDEGLYTLETAFLFLYRRFVNPPKGKKN